MDFTLPAVLVASLLGSVHCAAMCGGFVCAYSAGARGGDAVRAHALYNGGRLLAYLSLGALAGVVGATVTQLGILAGVGQAAAILAALLMIAWGVANLLAIRGFHAGPLRAPVGWMRFSGRILGAVQSQPVAIRALLTGLLTTLIPCGWLYVFVVAAGGTGSVVRSMLMMAVFWVGTVPALLVVGVSIQKAAGRFGRHMPLISAVAVLLIGLVTLGNRIHSMAQGANGNSHSAHVAHTTQ